MVNKLVSSRNHIAGLSPIRSYQQTGVLVLLGSPMSSTTSTKQQPQRQRQPLPIDYGSRSNSHSPSQSVDDGRWWLNIVEYDSCFPLSIRWFILQQDWSIAIHHWNDMKWSLILGKLLMVVMSLLLLPIWNGGHQPSPTSTIIKRHQLSTNIN